MRGAIGLVEYTPRTWVWPYAFVGVGGITYDLDQTVTPPLLTFIEHSRSGPVQRGDVLIVEDGRDFLLAVSELRLETVFAWRFASANCVARGRSPRIRVFDSASCITCASPQDWLCRSGDEVSGATLATKITMARVVVFFVACLTCVLGLPLPLAKAASEAITVYR